MVKARTERLVVEDLGKESIVYDLDSKKAHSLNESLKWIWKQCDGNKSVDEIADDFQLQFGSANGIADVRAGLQQLAAANLLVEEAPLSALFAQPTMTRRDVVGTASLAIPILTSILVPTSAAAKSRDKKKDDDDDDDDKKEKEKNKKKKDK